jgi:putative transposase
MARLPRLTVPGYPHHVIQRGNNRQPVFVDDQDRETLLALLGEYATLHKVAIHAWVLMDNHFHLLATPDTETGLPKMMQAVGRRYVQLFNRRHGRTGTLWEGRYRATLVQADRYLLACMAYIDLNPVRAGMVQRPADWRWSSHRHYIGQTPDRLVTPHPLIWSLGNTPFAREAAYADLVRQGIVLDQQKALTESALKGWALGDRSFLDALAERTARRTLRGRAGRPVAAKPLPPKA